MFTSPTIRAALTMLSVVALTLSAGAMTTQAATVTSTAHYQKETTLNNCAGNECSGEFPAVPAGHQLNVTRMSCSAKGTSGSTFSQGAILLASAHDKTLLNLYLPGGSSSSDGYHTLNQAVDLQVAATQKIVVYMVLASGTMSVGFCTATGAMDTLQ